MTKRKPISMIREELINKVVTAINESGLSYFVLEYVFKDILGEIHNGAVRQAQVEQTEYLDAVRVEAAHDSASSTSHIPEGTTVKARS